jgi:hypothetical protein
VRLFLVLSLGPDRAASPLVLHGSSHQAVPGTFPVETAGAAGGHAGPRQLRGANLRVGPEPEQT